MRQQDDFATAWRTRRKGELQGALGARRRYALGFEPSQHLFAAFRHRRPVALFVTTDVRLDALDLLLLTLRNVVLGFVASRAFYPIRRVIAWRKPLDAPCA